MLSKLHFPFHINFSQVLFKIKCSFWTMTVGTEISLTETWLSCLRAKYEIAKLEWTREWMVKLICETFANNKHLSCDTYIK